MPSSEKLSKTGFPGLRSRLSQAKSLYRAINTPLSFGPNELAELSPIKQTILRHLAPFLEQLQSTPMENSENQASMAQMLPGLMATINMGLQEISDQDSISLLLGIDSFMNGLMNELEPLVIDAARNELATTEGGPQ